MPGIPTRALKLEDLKPEGDKWTPLGEGSHKTFRVNFTEDGSIKSGFFKELEPKGHFPELLAKFSVAVSAILELIYGRAAKERLVFDKNNKIVGIVSIGVEGFKSFIFNYETCKETEKEEVAPSTETLIAKNFMEILLGRWFLRDDDGHPHNLSLSGDIDFDMFFHWLIVYMKGSRPGLKLPNPWVDLTTIDYERFPLLVKATTYHWAAFDHPGQNSIPDVLGSLQKEFFSKVLPKPFANPQAFKALAVSPEAQEQKVAAALKALLTFQPALLRKRLTALFGDLTLNYTSLPKEVQEQYEKIFPGLFNKSTDKEKNTNDMPFVDFIIDKIFQQHYNNLYSVVVFYLGCKDNGAGVPEKEHQFTGIPLAATHEELYRKPSFYKRVVEWMTKHNAACKSKENHYCLDTLKTRYHQIWRDAYLLLLIGLLKRLRAITVELGKEATDKDPEVLVTKEATDSSVTESWHLLKGMKEIKVDSEMLVPEKSRLGLAYTQMAGFYNSFLRITNAYYEKDHDKLTDDDNDRFVSELEALCSDKTKLAILDSLAHVTTHGTKFRGIFDEMRTCKDQMNFKLHLLSNDEQMQKVAKSTTHQEELLPLLHADSIDQFNKTLFHWVDSLSPELFNKYVVEIIDKKYETMAGSRYRGAPVKKYLEKSTECKQSNRNKLAYILCSGKTEDGALNQCLVQELTPKMLETNYLPNVKEAIKEKRFDLPAVKTLAIAAMSYAKNDDSFVHLHSQRGVDLFFQTLYQWVANVDRERLNRIVNAALTAYESGLWGSSAVGGLLKWGLTGGKASTSRRAEIEGYFDKQVPAKALATTFDKGKDTSTAGEHMLLAIITAIKNDIAKSKVDSKSPGYALIDLFTEAEDKEFYKTQIKGRVTQAILAPTAVPKAVAAKAVPSKIEELDEYVDVDVVARV